MHASVAQGVLAVASLALAAVPSLAEGPAKFEQSILYSNLRSELPSGRESFHGYKLGFAGFANGRLGLGGEVVQAEADNLDLLFVPELGVFDRGRVSVRIHVKMGAVRRLHLDSARRTVTPEWNFASTIGSSVDVYLAEGFAWRVVQPEIVSWRRGGESRTDFRVSTGVVLRFGSTD